MMNNIFLNYVFNYRIKNPMFKNTSKNSYFLKSSIIFTILFLVASIFNFVFAQQTYNLEIIFQRTAWDSYPNLYDYGISLAGGDVNGDGFSDIAVGASHWVDTLSWWAIDIYIFFGSSVMDTFYDAILHCPPHFGHNESVLWIGDVNGDSIGDIVVGDLGGGGYGEARVYFGGAPFDTLVDIILRDVANFGAFGCAVAGGDINGDNSNDIIVGSYTYNTLDGRVYVYYGGTLLDTTPDVIINGHNREAFGKNVGSGGDVNSDGFEDIVVGADENSEAYPGAGKVYVFCGGNPMDTIPDCWLHGEGVDHYLGWWGVAISEVTDNYDMVITGTRSYPGGFPGYNPGKTYVLYGGEPMDTLPDVWMIGKTDSSWLGNWCSCAGDVDGDGDEDIIVGAPSEYGFNGRGYVWLGGMPMDSVEDAYLEGDIFHHEIGWKVASAGDVNGDGYDEMMFGNYAGVEPTVWVCKYTGPGITERKAKSTGHTVEIYPNPFSRLMYIDLGTMQNIEHIELNIFDVTGRKVMNYEMKDRTRGFIVNMEDLPDGIYFVQIKDGNDKIIKKAVKVH